MNNDNNEFRKMRENLAKRGNIILHQMKINMQVLSKMSKKTKYWRGKLHSFETEIDAQACNVSYQEVKNRLGKFCYG